VYASLILAFAVTAAVQQPSPAPSSAGVVWGQVRSESSGAPIRYAIVQIIGPDGRARDAAQTDARGYYVLRDVPVGQRLIRATHLDHAPHEVIVIVNANAQVYHDFDLSLRPVELPVVTARAAMLVDPRPDSIRFQTAELGAAGVRVLEATPGMAEFGLAQAAREIPGHEPPDPNDVLFVRGGTADLKLILLNGAPVYAPFHIGGLINALDTDLVRSATLHVGGAPARYDGGLSYVLDMETRPGRPGQRRTQLGVDMLSARMLTEGSIGRSASYMVGGRGVHGYGASPFLDGAFPYGYGDGIARFDVDLGGGHSLTATGFWNREHVRIEPTERLEDAARWGNNAGALRYHGELVGGEALITLGYGDFATRLPLGGAQPLNTEGASRRVRLNGDFTRTLGEARLYYGASLDRQMIENRVWAREGSATEAVVRDANATVAGTYVDATITAVPGLRLRGGVRVDVFSTDPQARLAPRMSASFDLGQSATLTVAGGRYRQYVRSTDPSQQYVNATVPDEPVPPLKIAEATHVVVGLDQAITDRLMLEIEGFYKIFTGLPEDEQGRAEAEASGLDLWIRRGGPFTGWFGYSLAWVWSSPEQRPFAPGRSFAGRHLVSAGVSGPLVGSGNFDVRVAYGSGLPYTAIPEPELTTSPVFGVAFKPAADAAQETQRADQSIPNEPYLRLDAQVMRTWQGDWFGVAFAVTPYVKVLNALDRRDALFYHLERNESGGADLRALASLPVLPILGVEWRF
jgi:hypothetical protein